MRSVAFGLIINIGFLSPRSAARPQVVPELENLRRHSKRGLGQLHGLGTSEVERKILQLQEEMAERTINLQSEDNEVLQYEIAPKSQYAPETAAVTDRRQHRHHRHERKRHRTEDDALSSSLSLLSREESSLETWKIKADLHNSRRDSQDSFQRSVADDSRTAQHRTSHSYMGILQSRKRKACPSKNGKLSLLCPTRNAIGYDVCIGVEQLCDQRPDCPNGEDENHTNCLFYTATMDSIRKVVESVVAVTDHMVKSERNEL